MHINAHTHAYTHTCIPQLVGHCVRVFVSCKTSALRLRRRPRLCQRRPPLSSPQPTTPSCRCSPHTFACVRCVTVAAKQRILSSRQQKETFSHTRHTHTHTQTLGTHTQSHAYRNRKKKCTCSKCSRYVPQLLLPLLFFFCTFSRRAAVRQSPVGRFLHCTLLPFPSLFLNHFASASVTATATLSAAASRVHDKALRSLNITDGDSKSSNYSNNNNNSKKSKSRSSNNNKKRETEHI